MKNVILLNTNLYRIISELGDRTRYDYIMLADHTDYSFMPAGSTFEFSQRLKYHAIKNLNKDEIDEMASKQNCNPWTLDECIRSIKEHYEKSEIFFKE